MNPRLFLDTSPGQNLTERQRKRPINKLKPVKLSAYGFASRGRGGAGSEKTANKQLAKHTPQEEKRNASPVLKAWRHVGSTARLVGCAPRAPTGRRGLPARPAIEPYGGEKKRKRKRVAAGAATAIGSSRQCFSAAPRQNANPN